MPWPKGKPRSPETCLKMSIGMKGKKAWNKGKHPSEETRKKQSKAQRGRKHPEEVKQKMAEWHRGKPRDEETKRKLSFARTGTHLSEDTRAKISCAMRGKNNPHWNKPCSTETRALLAIANIGKKATIDAKRKMSIAQSGPNNPRWRGGSSYLPYCPKFNEAFKERVRDRFNRTCFLCGSKEETQKHCVHHIDYNKNSICNGHEWAFIPLCHSCHSKTNTRRWYWFNLLINYWTLNPEITL